MLARVPAPFLFVLLAVGLAEYEGIVGSDDIDLILGLIGGRGVAT